MPHRTARKESREQVAFEVEMGYAVGYRPYLNFL